MSSVFSYLQGILQGTAAVNANPRNTTITSENPNAGSSGTAPGTPGSVIVNLAAPVSTGVEASLQVARSGTVCVAAGAQPGGGPSIGSLWLGPSAAAPTSSNYAMQESSTTLYISTPQVLSFVGGNNSFGQMVGTGAHRGWQFGYPGGADFGTGDNVIGISAALTDPTTNPGAGNGILWENVAGTMLIHRGHLGAITGLAPTGSAGTINSQVQTYTPVIGTCETVSSNTPTAILTFTTASGTGGFMNLRCVSRATTTGTGIAVGDTAGSQYVLIFKNVAGTVTLSTAGISLISGSNQTTAAALTAPVLTATVATNVITIKVTNVNLCTIDSQLSGEVDAC